MINDSINTLIALGMNKENATTFVRNISEYMYDEGSSNTTYMENEDWYDCEPFNEVFEHKLRQIH